MKAETKGDFDEDRPSNPKIKEDYYQAELDEIIHYDRDDARGFVIKFSILDEDVQVLNDYDLEWSDGEIVLPFFAPGNLSKSEDAMSSRLTEHLENLGLHEAVLDILDEPVEVQTDVDEDGNPVSEEMSLKDAVLGDYISAKARTEDDADDLKSALNGVLAGKVVRVQVEDDRNGEESQVSKLSEIVEAEAEDSSENQEDGDSESNVILPEEDDEIAESAED